MPQNLIGSPKKSSDGVVSVVPQPVPTANAELGTLENERQQKLAVEGPRRPQNLTSNPRQSSDGVVSAVS